jgi:two-component system response regulator
VDKFILLVEDNPNDEAFTLRAFKKNNILNEIIVVRDGQEALDFLFCEGDYSTRDKSLNPQVILLDINLPKIDGLEVLQQLRANEHTELIPVVIMTTSDEQNDLIRSYQLGANSYIRKPVELNDFMQAVKQLGMYWLVLNQLPS